MTRAEIDQNQLGCQSLAALPDGGRKARKSAAGKSTNMYRIPELFFSARLTTWARKSRENRAISDHSQIAAPDELLDDFHKLIGHFRRP